ncbi:MAG: hypothetical protein H6741_30800 [Alphaproteobacteria bacterium]|nr:hypothetical protein [Alphaproteobacteria bacterium]
MWMSLICATALAQEITVTVDPRAAEQAGLDATQLEQSWSTELPQELHGLDLDAYMERMAKAAILSTKGMGVDYASNPQKFVVGASVGTAVNGAGVQLGRGPEALAEGGYALQLTAMGGLNLGIFAEDDAFLRRFVVYGHGMSLSYAGDPFGGSLLNYGGNLQVQLLKPRILRVAEWGGLALTAGYEVSDYTTTLAYPLPVELGGVTWTSEGTYRVSASTASVPVELSTNVRLLMFTVFGGVGQDAWATGEASNRVALSGPLSTTVNGQELVLGSAEASMAGASSVSWAMPRAFVGVQVDALMFKMLAQVNGTLDGGFGGHVGVRVAL